eukprot:3295428-Lingulodinium_polyedra.AAC.1
MSYRTLARRTAKGKLGFCVWHNRTDKCATCVAWDRHVSKMLMQSLLDMWRNALEFHAAFFDTWNDVKIPEASECVDKASYVNKFLQYVSDWPKTHYEIFTQF